MGNLLVKSPENILDDNRVRIYGSMQNRILLAMEDYRIQEIKAYKAKIREQITQKPSELLAEIASANLGLPTDKIIELAMIEHAKDFAVFVMPIAALFESSDIDRLYERYEKETARRET